MRCLIVAGVLAIALPAFGVEDPVPVVMEAATNDEVAPTLDPARGETAPAVEPEPVEAVPSKPPLSAEAVARGTFATGIDQREPVDSITSLGSDRDRVYYFTELAGIGGREVTHRWTYQGDVVAEVPITVGGPRWRAYSSKSLNTSQLGEWTVSVVDESGSVLRTDSFVYEVATPEPEIAAPEATPAAGDAPDEVPASAAPTQP